MVSADVTVDGEVKEMVQEVAKRLGGLDVMIANTGIARIAPLVSTDLEDWAQVMGTDLSFVTNMQHNRRLNKGGRIVSASATLGRAGGPMTVAYCVSKFAVRDLTQTAALELGQHNTTVNYYAPAFIQTPLLSLLDTVPPTDREMLNTALSRLGTGVQAVKRESQGEYRKQC